METQSFLFLDSFSLGIKQLVSKYSKDAGFSLKVAIYTSFYV
jgi:hypothetical protein